MPVWALNEADLKAVVGGFTGSQAGNVLTLTTSTSRTIAEAQQRFNIGANEQLRVLQPSSSSLFLLRVVPGQSGALERSVIDGSIYSNGQFWLQNGAGVMIGRGAVIDTAGFLATNMAVRMEDFMAARLTSLQNLGGSGGIVNQGEIKTSSGGSVYLIGDNVKNEGVITTPGGETILAAGQTVSLIDTGTPGVKVEITGAAGDVTNLGEIVATAGRIGMAGVIVRNSGTLNASSVVSEGGRVFLKASKDAYVDGAGRIVATGTKGGKVEVLGERVAVMDQAQIDVSGTNGGGTALVGGDYQGKNAEIQNATITYFGREASIKADAADNGDGGKVIVWADDTTRAYGNISARGGADGGNGGFVETSGKKYLDVKGIRGVVTSAPMGNAGTWLLDPTNITITHGAAAAAPFTGGLFDNGGGATSTLTDGDINDQLIGTSVVINTSGGGGGAGDIVINGTADGGGAVQIVNAAGMGRTLTLTADANIDMHAGASISGNTGGNTLGVTFNATGGVKLNPGATIKTYGGNVSMTGTGTSSYKSGIRIEGATVNAGGGSVTLTGTGYAGGSVNVGVLITGGADGARVETTGAGNIDITGTGGAGTDNDHGVLINGSGANTSRVLTQNGNITLTGTAGSSSATSMGVGIGGFDSYVEVSGTGNVVVDAITPSGGQGGDFTLFSSGTNGIRTNGGNITIKANNATLTSGGMISSGSGTITIAPHTASAQIILGTGATQSVNILGLTPSSLAKLSTSGRMVIGSATTGDVTVVGSLGLSSLPAGGLVLASGNDVIINSSLGSSSVSVTHSDSGGNWTNTQTGYSSTYGLSLLAGHAVNINAWTGNADTGAIDIYAGWNGASTSSPVLNSYAAGRSINIASGAGIASKGALTLKAVDAINITAGASSAGIDLDVYDLTVQAEKLTLTGGSAGNNARAFITTNGYQTFTLGTNSASGGLLLEGGTGAYYGGAAQISLYGIPSMQSFTIQNGAKVELKGGSQTGLWNFTGGECSAGTGCTGAGAEIRNNTNGGQSFVFTNGGTLNVYGGSGGDSNGADIENKGTGTQTITASTGSLNISLYGGTSGGATAVYGGKTVEFDNSAGIESKTGTQTISAASLALYGGSADYGGAFISAPTQNITVSGAVTLAGGTGGAPAGYDIYGDAIFYNPAIIGADVANTINMTVGSLTMTGGPSNSFGGSMAMIGGYRVASNVTISSSGNINLSSANLWSDRIGSFGGYGGSVSMTTTGAGDMIALGKAYVGTGSTGSVTLGGYGGITQDTTGRIEANSLTASVSETWMDVDLDGENKVAEVTITSPDIITYNSVGSTLLKTITSYGAGGITVTATNPLSYGGIVKLGTLSASSGAVSITAAQQILDDNGTTGNIAARDITLISTGGTADSSGIAVSADVEITAGGSRSICAVAGGTNCATAGTATFGGISIRNGGSLAPLSVALKDYSTTAGHAELAYTSAYAIDMTTGAYNLSSNLGGITFGTTGNLTLSNLATMLPGINDANYRYIKMSGQNVATSTSTALVSTPDLYINANGTLTIAAANNITNARNLGLNAVGGLSVSGSSISASANVYLGGVNNYGGGAITLTNSSVTAGNNIYAYTGGDIRLNNNSRFSAGYDINLGLGGTNSSVYLNDTTGYTASYIMSGSTYATNVGFPMRSADGIVIDGATTMTSAAYGSGIFRGSHGIPAAKGAGLNVLYGVAASAAVTQAVNDVVSTIVTTTTTATSSVSSGSTSSTSTTSVPPPPTTTTGTSSGLAALSSGTVGGAAGQFGDTSSTSTTAGTTTTSTSGTTTSTTGTTTGETSSSATSTTSSTSTTSGDSGGQSSAASGEQSNGSKDAKDAKDEKKEDKKDDKSKKADATEKKDDKSKSKPVGKCSA